MKKVIGHALFQLRCSYCQTIVDNGQKAVAVSFFIEGWYVGWEHKYINEESYKKEKLIKDLLKIKD